MSQKLNQQQAQSVLEDRVTKIVKAMQVLIKDAPRIADVLDEEARLKTEAFLMEHFAVMMRELALAADFRPARSSFSLNAPMSKVISMGSKSVFPTTEIPTVNLKVTIPDNIVPRDQELDDIVNELTAADFSTAPAFAPPSVPQPAKPAPWRKPSGRLVGTKELVYLAPEKPRGAGDDPSEVPHPKHGGIAEAGFIDAD